MSDGPADAIFPEYTVDDVSELRGNVNSPPFIHVGNTLRYSQASVLTWLKTTES